MGVFAYLVTQNISGLPFASPDIVTGLKLLAFTLPVFIVGLIEDISKAVRPALRLGVTIAAVIWMSLEADILITQTEISGLDGLLRSKWLAIGFTAFAIAGFSHALNIIDGINGLAAGVGIVMLAGVAVLANTAGETFVFELTLAGICGLLGFWAINFPRGRIFMGDGGAYFTGFWLAICATLLVMTPNVSACQMIAVCAYPVIETVFSMARRLMHRRKIGLPDRLHLHSLIYRRVYLTKLKRRGLAPWHSHAATTASLMALNLVFVFAAIQFGNNPRDGLLVLAAETAAYWILYRKIVRFKWF